MDALTERFEAHRAHLNAVAFRMLGSSSEAEDAVQEAWLRLSRTDTTEVTNFGGWLTTVVARICLDMLRSRKTRREDELRPLEHADAAADPEKTAMIADAIGPALLIVLEHLTPAERIAFVLHDMFAVSFEEIATIVDKTPAAARQLASRARRRVGGQDVPADMGPDTRKGVVEAFVMAVRNGDFQKLIAVLDPSVVVRPDAHAVSWGAQPELRGVDDAAAFLRRARAARFVIVDGLLQCAWIPKGEVRVVFSFTVTGDRVTAVDLIADPAHLATHDIEILEE